MTTLIVSDVHLGASFDRVKDLTAFIKSVDFSRLIILGDLFDRPDLRGLKEEEWTFLQILNNLGEHKDVVWVEGNHDEKLINTIPSLFNISAVREYSWSAQGKNLLALHGHQFDDYTDRKSYLTSLAGGIYRFLRRIDLKLNRDIFHNLCYDNGSWKSLSDKINNKALEYAEKKKADFIFCGHTHRAMNLSKNGVEYFNTGCWNDRYCHYVLIDDQRVSLNIFDKPVKSQHSSAPGLRVRHAV